MPGALIAQGVKLKRGDGQPTEAFTTIARLHNLSLNIETEEIDVTAHDSTGNWGEFIGGRHSGEITAEMYYDPNDAQHEGIRNDQLNRTIRNYQIEWPSSPVTVDTYKLIITEFEDEWEGTGEEAATAEITYRITQQPVFG